MIELTLPVSKVLTPEAALRDSISLWRFLTNHPSSTKSDALRILNNSLSYPYIDHPRISAYSHCPLCLLHMGVDCLACPWPGNSKRPCRCAYTKSGEDSIYTRWFTSPSGSKEKQRYARVIFNLLQAVYRREVHRISRNISLPHGGDVESSTE